MPRRDGVGAGLADPGAWLRHDRRRQLRGRHFGDEQWLALSEQVGLGERVDGDDFLGDDAVTLSQGDHCVACLDEVDNHGAGRIVNSRPTGTRSGSARSLALTIVWTLTPKR